MGPAQVWDDIGTVLPGSAAELAKNYKAKNTEMSFISLQFSSDKARDACGCLFVPFGLDTLRSQSASAHTLNKIIKQKIIV